MTFVLLKFKIVRSLDKRNDCRFKVNFTNTSYKNAFKNNCVWNLCLTKYFLPVTIMILSSRSQRKTLETSFLMIHIEACSRSILWTAYIKNVIKNDSIKRDVFKFLISISYIWILIYWMNCFFIVFNFCEYIFILTNFTFVWSDFWSSKFSEVHICKIISCSRSILWNLI